MDRNDKVFAWRGETFGGQITSENVSADLRNAVVATEDKRFYRHFGVSPRGIASAIRINLSEGRGPLEGNGGSTITQQVAKLLCLGVKYDPTQWKSEAAYEEDCRSGGIKRKLEEIPFAIAMEFKYTKAEILTIYFNRAYLGAGARGFEAAAQRYFGVSANQVDPAQAAMLAGLLKAPSRFAPTNNLQRAQERANVVLGLMEDQGYLTADGAAEARWFGRAFWRPLGRRGFTAAERHANPAIRHQRCPFVAARHLCSSSFALRHSNRNCNQCREGATPIRALHLHYFYAYPTINA
jgi:penicillin-binding protein 1A